MRLEYYQDIVSVQIALSERPETIRKLRALEQQTNAAQAVMRIGPRTVVRNAHAFEVDCSKSGHVKLTLRPDDLRCLIEAIEEHIADGVKAPLDHAFKPLGASIIPSSIRDVVFETIDPRSMNVHVYKENAIHSLEELADIRMQHRRWLSAGGSEVSSFTEAVCQLFDDTGLGDALEKPDAPPVFSASIDDRLRELSKAVGRFDHEIEPQKQIDHPDMQTIRDLAARILAEIG
ncbi:MAG TPA: hypothetical protein VFW87_03960, partial [Pirellulales bacterium]|nr:hypothetical protein [Pirellulales bacterium]